MSFSGNVKEELLSVTGNGRHCQLAEMAAIFEFCGFIKSEQGKGTWVGISTDNKAIAKKSFALMKKLVNTFLDVSVTKISKQSKGFNYRVYIQDEAKGKEFLMALKVFDEAKGLIENPHALVNSILLKKDCCRRAYVRGVFLSIGSLSDPEKGYHMEFVCGKENQADALIENLKTFGIGAKKILRKKSFVVYLKDGEAIVDMLNIMGAHVALMELENTRIVKDVRNSINRRVNCEAANIQKTVAASTRQIEDIQFIQEFYGFHKLPDNLRQMAEVRLEYPGATLSELTTLMDPPVGKSGVNHRLRKLSELAEKIRNG